MKKSQSHPRRSTSAMGQSSRGPARYRTATAEHPHESALSSDEMMILREIHRDNEAEMEMGKMATERSVNQDIIDYGQRLINDHESADQKIWAVAEEHHARLDDQPHNSQEQKKMKEEMSHERGLEAMESPEFDQAFVEQMIRDHEKAISRLEEAQDRLPEDSSVTKVIDELLPVLRRHEKIAEDLVRAA